MEKENPVPLKWYVLAISIFILLLLISLYTPLTKQLVSNEYPPVLIYCIGIALIFIIIGFFSILGFLHIQWKIDTDYTHLMKEKAVENKHREEIQKLLNEDAEKRRTFERERNRINDLFRLIELAKEKSEEITDNTKTKVEGITPKLIENNIYTKKNDLVNTDTLDKLIDHYQKLTPEQQTKTP